MIEAFFEAMDKAMREQLDAEVLRMGRPRCMDPFLLAAIAKFGLDAVLTIVQAWQESGQPTADQIRAAAIEKKPEEYFKP